MSERNSARPKPTPVVETTAGALAAQAKAAVEARYIMAMQRPRDWDQVRLSLLKECDRTNFAEVAIYRKPVGQGIEGPSIRFAEAAHPLHDKRAGRD